jgi:uncharacterized protein (DUF983 family)
MMEEHSVARKRGRYDCPACGERIMRLVHRGSFFHMTSHCPYCGVRLSTDIFHRASQTATSIVLLSMSVIILLSYPHRHRTLRIFFMVAYAPFLLYEVYYLAHTFRKGAYQIISDGTQKTPNA